MRIDLDAPIIPWIGLGGIRLYSKVDEIKDILNAPETKKEVSYDDTRYEIENAIYIFVNNHNNKVYKLTATDNYRGTLFEQIKIGMNVNDILKIEPSFEYEDFEEVFISPKGILVERDLNDIVFWISVHIEELNTISDDDFWAGKW